VCFKDSLGHRGGPIIGVRPMRSSTRRPKGGGKGVGVSASGLNL